MKFLGLSPLLLLLGVGFFLPSVLVLRLISLYALDASSLASSSISFLFLGLCWFLEWDDQFLRV